MDIHIVYEDQHILVAEKPPKVPSQSDKTGDCDMLSMLREHLKTQYPGVREPYIGLIHRLDRPVGGLMVFAKTKEANAKLSEQIRNKVFQKEYYAVVCGRAKGGTVERRDYLIKHQATNMSKVVSPNHKNAKEAVLEYTCLDTLDTEEYGALSLLKIHLKTGRHHQIRVQMAHEGLPLWGDNKYNETFVKKKGWTQIALWAGLLSFVHPKTKKMCTFSLKPEQGYPFSLFGFYRA